MPNIETYISAAKQHGEDSDPDHEVGDLQDMLRSAWELLSEEQRLQLVRTPAFEETLEYGAEE